MNETGWRLENSYARLPERFYARVPPVPVRAPSLVMFNHKLAASLGLNFEHLPEPELAALFSGNTLPPGAEPLAMAYAGHQFGHFTILGDGRAHLLGEQITSSQQRFDIQLKGSGQTPFSRRGDGRAALGPMLREYILSEALHALGIPTTRSLAVIATGEPVLRETALPGAILTRVARSHIRVGTFEFFAAREDREGLKILADYTIQRHYPALAEAENPYLELLRSVIEKQASLVSQWMLVGFVHGVMNTDNMTLSGETIDYGPCAFMDAYDPATVFSSIDQFGRYAYGNQPVIAQWNLARFAEALLPLLHPEMEPAIARAEDAITGFSARFQHHWFAGMRQKLGLFGEEPEDAALIQTLLEWMQREQADYTNTLRDLSEVTLPDHALYHQPDFLRWRTQWQARLAKNSKPLKSSRCLMRASNPARIPRNQRVEEALTAAVEQGDLAPTHRLLEALAQPYEDHPAFAFYRQPPQPGADPYRTFCGT
jgi:serine/tyrosine/threonine adenylyltransferase